jgi:hypothetical protein
MVDSGEEDQADLHEPSMGEPAAPGAQADKPPTSEASSMEQPEGVPTAEELSAEEPQANSIV